MGAAIAGLGFPEKNICHNLLLLCASKKLPALALSKDGKKRGITLHEDISEIPWEDSSH